MPQIDNKFTAIWIDTTTAPGVMLTGLSATISIRRKDTNEEVVNEAPMVEIGEGEYDYTYEDMILGIAYSYRMNPNSSLAFIESGFVDPRMGYLDRPISKVRGVGGGLVVDYKSIEQGLAKDREWLTRNIENLPNLITTSGTTIFESLQSINTFITLLMNDKSIENLSTEFSKLSESNKLITETAQTIARDGNIRLNTVLSTIEKHRKTDEIQKEMSEIDREIAKALSDEQEIIEKEISKKVNDETRGIDIEIDNIYKNELDELSRQEELAKVEFQEKKDKLDSIKNKKSEIESIIS